MPFSFNIYSSLLLPAVVNGLVFTGMLFYRGWQENRLSDRLLALLVLMITIKVSFWMLGFAGWYDTHDSYTSFMFYFPFEVLIWTGPLLYFYFLSLTNQQFSFGKKDWVHLVLPAAALLLVLLKFAVDFLVYHPFPVMEQNQYGTKGPWADITRSYTYGIISYISFIYYVVITVRAYTRYREYVKQNFSSLEQIEFTWIRNILYAIVTGMLLFFVFEIIGLLSPGGLSYSFNWYAYFGLGIIGYYVAIAGYHSGSRHYRLSFSPEPEATPQATAPLQAFNDQAALESLQIFMLNQKPHLDPELTLAELARQRNTVPAVLSRLINEGTDQNFNDFVNQFRVNEVLDKLRAGEHKSQTLLGIAFDAGFNSKATFNRSFRKIMGISPKEWIEQNLTP